MNRIKILTAEKFGTWDHFVSSHQQGTVYHTSHWANVIQNSYKHHPMYLVLENDDESIIAGFPLFIINTGIFGKKLSCLPLAHYSNPLTNTQEQYIQFIEYIKKTIEEKNIQSCEIKTSDDYKIDGSYQKKHDTGYCTHLLSLDKPADEIFKSFHKNCIQRPIRKADKHDLKLVVGQSIDHLKQFYHLYLKMRKQNGLLPQPYRFFKSLWDQLSPNQMVEILHAEYKGKVISSILLLKYKDTVIYEYGASLKGYVHLHPSHFLLWKAIQRAHNDGFKEFDFGRTTDDNINLMTFKNRWGTKRVNLYYYYIPEISGVSKIRQKSLLKKIMNVVVKIMPDPVCHLMGKIVYKNLV